MNEIMLAQPEEHGTRLKLTWVMTPDGLRMRWTIETATEQHEKDTLSAAA